MLEPVEHIVQFATAFLQTLIEASELCEDTKYCRWCKYPAFLLNEHISCHDFVGKQVHLPHFLPFELPGYGYRLMLRQFHLFMPEFSAQEDNAVARFQAVIFFSSLQLRVIFSRRVEYNPLKHEWTVGLLYFNVKQTAILTLAAEVQNGFLGSKIVGRLLPVTIMFDILHPDIIRQQVVEHTDQQLLVVLVRKNRLEARVFHKVYEQSSLRVPFRNSVRFLLFSVHSFIKVLEMFTYELQKYKNFALIFKCIPAACQIL